VALWDDILRLLGTNRTRLRWKWERLKGRLAAQRSRAENRARVVTYAHKACLHCGHPADRFARRCSACGGRLPGVVRAKLTALARVLIDEDGSFAASSVLLVANVGVYLLMFKQSGNLMAPSREQLIRWGAWISLPPFDRDWPRWITSCFLHGGLMHIVFNMMGLLQLAPITEGIFGRRRFSLIYLFAGFAGMMTSVLWRAHTGEYTIGIGASGAIFGLIGAQAAYGLRRGGRIAAEFRRSFLTWAVYAFLMGYLLHADNLAHAGGFIGGALCALGLSDRTDPRPAPPWLWALVELALIGIVVYSGWHVWHEGSLR
jgi:membrane associated rhomboid family serine protease